MKPKTDSKKKEKKEKDESDAGKGKGRKAKDVEGSAFSCGMIRKRVTKSDDENFVDEDSKHFYLLQIKNLEDQIHMYQRLCDQMSVKLQDSSKYFEDNDKERVDIIDFLKSSLEKKSEELDFSEGQVKERTLEVENQRKKYETEILALKREFEETKNKMTNEINTLTSQMKSLEKYQLEKEEVRMEVESTLEKLNQMKANHSAEIIATERKQVMQLTRLRSDVYSQVNRLAAAFSSNVRQKVSEKARDTIKENVQNSHLLAEISCETQELLIKNKELKERLHEMKLKIEILEETERQLQCRNCSLRKVINLMKNEAQRMRQIENDYNQLKAENEILRNDFKDQQHYLQVLKDKEEKSRYVMEEMKAALDLAKDRAKRVNKVNVQLRRLLSDAAAVVRKALESPTSEECAESAYSVFIKRKAVVHQLSVLLGSAAVLGSDQGTSAGGEGEEEGEEEVEEEEEGEDGRQTVSSVPKTVCEVDASRAFQRVITAQRPSKVLPARWRQASLTPQYRRGDLGAVRPNRLPHGDQRPGRRLRSADSGPQLKQPIHLRFSLIHRITDALIQQTA